MLCSDVYWDDPKSRTTGQDLDSTMASGVDPNVEAGIAKTMVVASRSGPQKGTAKEGDTESDVERSSEEVEESRAVGAMPRSDTEAEVNAEIMYRPDAEVAKDPAHVEEEANKEHEVARTKEKADAEARKAAAEAKAKREAGLKAKAEAEARARVWVEERARRKQEEAKKAEKKAKKAAKVKANAEAQKAAAAKKAKKAANAKANAEAQKAAAAKKAKKAAKNANASNRK
ncbi:hypothetical protein EDB86DRAFT_2987647, partial [Lactarius hatsudake]